MVAEAELARPALELPRRHPKASSVVTRAPARTTRECRTQYGTYVRSASVTSDADDDVRRTPSADDDGGAWDVMYDDDVGERRVRT